MSKKMDQMDKEYRELLLGIAQKITNDELATMKFLMPTDSLPDKSNSDKVLIDALSFFRNLEKQQKLGLDDLGGLIYLLQMAKRSDLVSKVNEFQSRKESEDSLQSEVSNKCASSLTPAEISHHQQDQGVYF